MKKAIVFGLVLALAATSLSPALAGKKGKKKKAKKWVSEEVSVATGHPATLVGAGLVRTAFETECAVPATQGTDAAVFEVPANYQEMSITISSFGSGGHDIDLFLYNSSCTLTGEFGSETEDEVGFGGPGTAYVIAANYRPSGMTVHLEIEKTKAVSF